MNAVFVDTGYLLALELANDQHHQDATRHWQGVVRALPRLVTTSYVFDEVVTFFSVGVDIQVEPWRVFPLYETKRCVWINGPDTRLHLRNGALHGVVPGVDTHRGSSFP